MADGTRMRRTYSLETAVSVLGGRCTAEALSKRTTRLRTDRPFRYWKRDPSCGVPCTLVDADLIDEEAGVEPDLERGMWLMLAEGAGWGVAGQESLFPSSDPSPGMSDLEWARTEAREEREARLVTERDVAIRDRVRLEVIARGLATTLSEALSSPPTRNGGPH